MYYLRFSRATIPKGYVPYFIYIYIKYLLFFIYLHMHMCVCVCGVFYEDYNYSIQTSSVFSWLRKKCTVGFVTESGLFTFSE